MEAAAPSTASPKPRFHIPSLDGLRAVAFMIVFLSHVGLGKIFPGAFGVMIFFFMSGFLITTLMRMEVGKTGTVNVGKSYSRRFVRIFPPLFLMLAFCVIAVTAGWLPGTVRPSAIASLALCLGNYWQVFTSNEGFPPGTGLLWAIAVEVHFYLIAPFLGILIIKKLNPRKAALFLATLCAAILLWRCYWMFIRDSGWFQIYVRTDTRIDAIFFGCILGIWQNPALDPVRFQNKTVRRTAVICSAGVLFLSLFLDRLLLLPEDQRPLYRETIRYTVQGLFLMPIFYCAVLDSDWLPFRILNNKWIVKIGVMSYSLFLVHLLIINMVQYNLFPQMATAKGAQWGMLLIFMTSISAVMTLVVAAILFYGVEEPLNRLRARLQG